MYIPDFNFDLCDLTCFTDEEIKGTVMSRVVLLLMKHVFDQNLLDRLPKILTLMKKLMKKLMEKETG